MATKPETIECNNEMVRLNMSIILIETDVLRELRDEINSALEKADEINKDSELRRARFKALDLTDDVKNEIWRALFGDAPE